MDIFMDLEFTGLHQHTSIVSIGLVAENGMEFYAEFNDYDLSQVNEWLIENVFRNLTLIGQEYNESNGSVQMKNNKHFIAAELEEWFAQFDSVTIWSDTLAYDWILFCELFGGALHIPKNIYYIPMDIATLFLTKGIDPDINRKDFSGVDGTQHNALDDAYMIKHCYERLMEIGSAVTME